MTDVDTLMAEIRRAFPESVYPGDGNLIYDTSGTHDECEQVRQDFTGRRWSSLDRAFMIAHRNDYTCFSSDAFRYYFPAFLLFAAGNYDEADDLPMNLVSALTLPTELDSILVAHNIKKYGLDKQMPDIDFDLVLRNQLYYTNQDLHNFFARFGSMTTEQGRAVLHFLQHLDEQHSEDLPDEWPKTAIDRYWFQFA